MVQASHSPFLTDPSLLLSFLLGVEFVDEIRARVRQLFFTGGRYVIDLVTRDVIITDDTISWSASPHYLLAFSDYIIMTIVLLLFFYTRYRSAWFRRRG